MNCSTPLRRTSPLQRSSRPLERRTPLGRGKGPSASPGRSQAGTGARGVSPASRPQRIKVRAEGRCRVCGLPDTVTTIDPAHVADRSLGGCDQPDCTVPLCRAVCHPAYDEGRLDLLPFLSKSEQAHCVAHLEIVAALHRTTNDRGAR